MAKDDWFQIKRNVGRKTPPEWVGGYISSDGQTILYIDRFTRPFGYGYTRKEWGISMFIPARNATVAIPPTADLLTKKAAQRELERYMREHRH